MKPIATTALTFRGGIVSLALTELSHSGEHQHLKLGLPEYPDSGQTIPFLSMLLMPWKKQPASVESKLNKEKANENSDTITAV